MRQLLHDILKASSPSSAMSWLDATILDQETEFKKRPFYYSFSGVSRHFEKQGGITVSEEQLAAISTLLPGCTVKGWDQFRLARVILLLVLGQQDRETFLETIAALLNTADLREQSAIFSALPLLPHQEDLVEAAVDGLRSNIVDIFDSITLGNPFPAKHFSDEEWNQMALKTIFINRPVYRLTGLRERANRELALSISYLAHERWAAARKISPEAWQHCTDFVDKQIKEDLVHLIEQGDALDREAAALVIASNPGEDLNSLREKLSPELSSIEVGTLSWRSLGENLEFPLSLNGSPSLP
jgi:hypothetical protein